MKNEWLITFRSITFAQKGQRLLKMRNIPCILQRTPKALTERGCGYCLRLSGRDALSAVTILQRERLQYEKIYAIGEDGEMEERVL